MRLRTMCAIKYVSQCVIHVFVAGVHAYNIHAANCEEMAVVRREIGALRVGGDGCGGGEVVRRGNAHARNGNVRACKNHYNERARVRCE